MTATARWVDYDPLRDRSYEATRLGPSIVDFLAWKKTGNAAARTLDQYERDLARGALMFPDVDLERFGDSEMQHVAASFQPKERRVRIAAWRSFFRWALRYGLIDRNPVDRLPDLRSEPQRFIDVFSDEELAVLTALPVRDGALMQLLFDAGLRKSEARNFRLAHLRGSEIVILRGKGGKDRVIPASPEVSRQISELAWFDKLEPRDFLWYTRPGGGNRIDRSKPLLDSPFHRWWGRCLQEAGVPYRNPHVARHTFATRWLRRGGRLDLLSMAMGHASIKTTFDLYAHLDTSDLTSEFARLFPTGVES